ncbi:MAG: hypothetical protein ACLGI6_06755 [Gammaproteobacteria bacterium]
MNFPNEATFNDRLAMLASTFSHRLGPMVLLAALFGARDSGPLHWFWTVVAAWIVFEALNKLYFSRAKSQSGG